MARLRAKSGSLPDEARRPIRTLANGLKLIPPALTVGRRVAIDLLVLVSVGFLTYHVIAEAMVKSIVVEPISVPPDLASRGYSPTVLSAHVAGEMVNMNRTAEARVPQLPVLESRDIPNVVVPGEEISLSELIRHVKTEFGKADILIRGDITEDALNYIGRIQVSGERHNWRVETATASIAKEAAAIIPAIAKAAMHKSSPYVLLMYELNVERSHCSSTAPCNYKEPLALVNEMLAKPPSGVKVARLYIARSYIAEREGHLKDSLEDARTAAALDPRSAVALFNWGVVLSALHQPAKAIEKYERTLKIDPEFADAYDNWGNALVRQGLPEKALEKYAQAVQKNPKHTKAYTNWGLALFKLDRTKEAFEKYKQAVRIDPHYIDAYYYWGNTLLHSGQPEKAIEKYKQAIQINPKIAKLHFNLGNALLKLGRKKEAKKEFAVGERLKRGVGQQRSRSEDEP